VVGICYDALAAGQLTCSQTRLLRESPALQVVRMKVGQSELWCDMSRGAARPLVPALHRRVVFDAVHSGAEIVSIASGAKSPGRPQLLSSPYLYLGGVFHIFTWILWGLFQCPRRGTGVL
jgi:hypothetical protein